MLTSLARRQEEQTLPRGTTEEQCLRGQGPVLRSEMRGLAGTTMSQRQLLWGLKTKLRIQPLIRCIEPTQNTKKKGAKTHVDNVFLEKLQFTRLFSSFCLLMACQWEMLRGVQHLRLAPDSVGVLNAQQLPG